MWTARHAPRWRDEGIRSAHLRRCDVLPPAARRELRIGEQLQPVEHRAGGHARTLEDVRQSGVLKPAGPCREVSVDLRLKPPPPGYCTEEWVAAPVRVAHRPPQRPPLNICFDGDGDPGVGPHVAATGPPVAGAPSRPLSQY